MLHFYALQPIHSEAPRDHGHLTIEIVRHWYSLRSLHDVCWSYIIIGWHMDSDTAATADMAPSWRWRITFGIACPVMLG